MSCKVDWMAVGGVLGGFGVASGAFGHHCLQNRDSKVVESWMIGATYQMVHATAIIALAGKGAACRAPALFTTGICLFSGSIYGLVLMPRGSGFRKVRKVLGPMTPVGGLFMISGWFSLAWPFVQRRFKTQ
eukprot:NODE_22215_length_717_cov_6.227119.p2 GENE.NODE_22215_length_717_cov_6.227119~~NODE_22215_length_717_cov_6.227119.p2  ORF type:complete len:131 (-),score=28.08 NODE_22215_length_717_cov_6.227119:238-630(-)